MSTFNLTIELGNDAMSTTEQVAEALHKVAYYVEQHDDENGTVKDENGNTVGTWAVTEGDAHRDTKVQTVNDFVTYLAAFGMEVSPETAENFVAGYVEESAADDGTHDYPAHDFVEMVDGTCYHCEKPRTPNHV